MDESRKVLGSLIVLGMILSTFTVAVSVVATSLPLKLIPNISLAPTENLVGYWSFDEASGTTASDGSGMGNNGTVYGATWVSGKVNNALNFDGVNDYVEVPYNSSLDFNALTWTAWIKFDAPTSGIIGKASTMDLSGEWIVGITSDTSKLAFDTLAGSSLVRMRGNTALSSGTWYHVAGTYDGLTMKVYVNGTEDGSASQSGSLSINMPLRIGRVGVHYFDGIIDEVRLYRRALSASEINSIYQEGATSLLISPSSFTLASGGSTTLTATLKDSANNALANKTISWSATAGSLSATSGTTNSSGQVSVTYTSPTVTSQTSVTVTASFAGDASYGSSSGTSSGTINPMAGYWSLNETSGSTASDGSGMGNNGTVYGATWVSGKVGNALSFDGVNDYVEVPYNSSLDFNALTWTAWIKFDVPRSGIIGKASTLDLSGEWFSGITSDTSRLTFETLGGSGIVRLYGNTALSTGTWYHVAATYDGTTMKTYVNGALDGSASQSGSLSINMPLHIARAGIHYYDGIIDEVRLYSRALSASEISAIYQEAGVPSTTLSISPSSFTLSSGGSTTLTATLTSGGSAVASKTISWAATSGSVSPSSGTTNSSGQVTVTYTAPTVTAQMSVAITASFAGDASYGSSSGTSSGTITAENVENVVTSTTLSISPSSFTLSSGGSTTLTATLTFGGYAVAGKTISWAATSGSVNPSSGTTNSSGQVTVTYTAPTVTAQTSVTITASFAGDASYGSSSGTSSGTIVPPPTTALSISPSSFTLSSGGSTTLTATLTFGGYAVASKTISWSATSGSVNPSSGTTNSSGQVTVTYTAPTVTAQTSVTITASFAGDAGYSSSQASSVGAISPTAQVSTSIIISPLVFDAKSGENVLLTILLTGESGAPAAGKAVTLGTTVGSIVPSSGTADNFGVITAMFTAPSVDVRTSFIITASFAGDDEYSPSVAYSTGTVLPSELAETVERLENTMQELEVSVEDLSSKIESLTSAIAENRLALVITVENSQSATEYEHTEIDAEVKITGTNIEVRVDSQVEIGKTVLVNIDSYTKTVLQLEHIVIWVDNVQIEQADDYDDVLDPTNDGGEAEYLILAGGNGVQVLVSIPHFSTRTITIGTLPTQPFGGEIPMWVIVGAALALVLVLTVVVWRHLRESRGDATSLLIEHGLPDMRIAEVEVVREIRGMGEFTIPDLMQRTGSSKVLIWRTVQKLMKKGLVEPTEEVKPPATGRGKPSMVFKYVGD